MRRSNKKLLQTKVCCNCKKPAKSLYVVERKKVCHECIEHVIRQASIETAAKCRDFTNKIYDEPRDWITV